MEVREAVFSGSEKCETAAVSRVRRNVYPFAIGTRCARAANYGRAADVEELGELRKRRTSVHAEVYVIDVQDVMFSSPGDFIARRTRTVVLKREARGPLPYTRQQEKEKWERKPGGKTGASDGGRGGGLQVGKGGGRGDGCGEGNGQGIGGGCRGGSGRGSRGGWKSGRVWKLQNSDVL